MLKKVLRFSLSEQGFAIVAVIATIVILFMVLAGTTAISLSSNKQQAAEACRRQAYYMAESGLAFAQYQLNECSTPTENYDYPSSTNKWFENTGNFKNGNSYSLWVTKNLNGYEVTSKGKSGNYTRTLRVTFAGMAFPDKLKLTVDPGSADPNHQYYDPSYHWAPLDYSPPADCVKYSEIVVKNGDPPVVFHGPVSIHVTGNIDLGIGTKLICEGAGPVKIYLDGNMVAKNNSEIKCNQRLELYLKGGAEDDPQQQITLHNSFTSDSSTAQSFLICASTKGYTPNPPPDNISLNFDNKANVTLAIFAPNSLLNLLGNTSGMIYGAAVVRNVKNTGLSDAGQYINYDPSLGNMFNFIMANVRRLNTSWRDLD